MGHNLNLGHCSLLLEDKVSVNDSAQIIAIIFWAPHLKKTLFLEPIFTDLFLNRLPIPKYITALVIGKSEYPKFWKLEIRQFGKFGKSKIRKIGKLEIRKYEKSEIRTFGDSENQKFGKSVNRILESWKIGKSKLDQFVKSTIRKIEKSINRKIEKLDI